MTEALRSAELSSAGVCVVIDNFGELWSFNAHLQHSLKVTKIEGDYPFFVSVALNSRIYALDEFGDVGIFYSSY